MRGMRSSHLGGASAGDEDAQGCLSGGDKGCACNSNGVDPGDVGRFLLFGLALVKRRS